LIVTKPEIAMQTYCHIEIPAVNLEAEAAFYSKLFGWTTEPMRPGEYLFYSDREGTLLGGLTRVDQMPDNSDFQNYVAVQDVSVTLAEAKRLGAAIPQERRDLGHGMGFIGVFKSPDGFHLGIWSQQ
jgi:predicted enzyme related to lactoylglutathione lyase